MTAKPQLLPCKHCGALFKKLKDRRLFCSPGCRRNAFYKAFKEKNPMGYKTFSRIKKELKGRYKRGSRTALVGGVRRSFHKEDGWCWIASICVSGDARQKRFRIEKMGEAGAKTAAAFLRMSWMIEMNVWNPRDGDPFAILNSKDVYSGNSEYEDCVVDPREIRSPYLHYRDDD